MTPADKHRTAASEQTTRTDEEERAEMDRVAVDLGFKSAKDMAGALLDHEIETTTDIERLRFWAQNLRKLSKYKIEKLESELSTANARLERLRELAKPFTTGLTAKISMRDVEALRAELGEG